MPYLKIQSNVKIPEENRESLTRQLSATVAQALGKAERYVMIALEPTATMCLAGDAAPCAYLELKSIGLPGDCTAQLSRTLCEAVGAALDVPAERIYIEFADAPRHLWGWNGATF